MEQRVLGRTDLSVSVLGMGGLFTSRLGPGYDESKQAVRRALDLGICYVDTAPRYADSEEVLGRILRDLKPSEPLLISTKLGGRPDPFDPTNAAQLRASVEESLRLLGRDVIDILFIHEPDRPQLFGWWSDFDRVEGTVLEVMEELKKKGVIRYTGLGGTTCTEMAHLMRSGKFDVVLTAFNYSLLFREAACEVFPAARDNRMGVVMGSVLQQGGLGRRFDEVVKAKPSWLSQPRREQFMALYALLDEAGLDIVEAGLRMALGNPDGHTILFGPKTASHVEQAVAAVEKGPLPSDVMQRLDEVAAMVPFRPFEEPMLLPFRNSDYKGPGTANHG